MLRRLDAATGDEVAQIAIVPPPQVREAQSVFTPMVANDDAVWIGADGLDALFRVGTATNAVTASVLAPGGARDLAPAPDGVYAALGNPAGGPLGGRLVRIDDTGAEAAAIDVGEVGESLAFDGTTLWMRSSFGTVTRHDPSTLAPLSEPLTFSPGTRTEGLAAALPGAWISVDQGLLPIDETLRRRGLVPVVGAAGSSAVGAGADALWVLDSGLLVRVDT
jgi:hypothetical protein